MDRGEEGKYVGNGVQSGGCVTICVSRNIFARVWVCVVCLVCITMLLATYNSSHCGAPREAYWFTALRPSIPPHPSLSFHHFPIGAIIGVVNDACTRHEVCAEGEEADAAFESAANISYLDIGGDMHDNELIIIDKVAYIEISSVNVQVSARLDGVG